LNKYETSLRAKVANVNLLLEKLTVKKEERVRKFTEIRSQIEQIRAEISGSSCQSDVMAEKEDHDLSLRRLEEFQAQLNYLQREKVFNFLTRKYLHLHFVERLLFMYNICQLASFIWQCYLLVNGSFNLTKITW
jgi:hypothetical protein